jgi:hypothetical protein
MRSSWSWVIPTGRSPAAVAVHVPGHHASPAQYLVVAPSWSPYRVTEGATDLRFDHPVDHPGDPRGPVWIRLDRRGTQRELARSA